MISEPKFSVVLTDANPPPRVEIVPLNTKFPFAFTGWLRVDASTYLMIGFADVYNIFREKSNLTAQKYSDRP
jgi:hypothetical protein